MVSLGYRIDGGSPAPEPPRPSGSASAVGCVLAVTGCGMTARSLSRLVTSAVAVLDLRSAPIVRLLMPSPALCPSLGHHDHYGPLGRGDHCRDPDVGSVGFV